MEVGSQYSTLSLSQRAHVIARQWNEFYGSLIFIILLLGALIIADIVTSPPDPKSIVDVTLFTVVMGVILLYILYAVFKLKHLHQHFKSWDQDYLRQAYILVFDTTVPKGNTNAEKIYNLATAVFPELLGSIPSISLPTPINRLLLYLKSKLKNLRRRTNIPKTWNYKVDSYTLDLVQENDSGVFIIKDFKDNVVKLNDLKQLVKATDGAFKAEIFRTICVAKHYDQTFLDRESLDSLMRRDLKADFPIDLTVEEDVGYTAIWIS